MASDEDYMAFLNKANQDAEEGQAAAASSAQSAGQQRTFKTTDEGSKLPKSIADVLKDAFYVSEADEPFKGVSLKWKGEGGLPDEGEWCLFIFLFFYFFLFWIHVLNLSARKMREMKAEEEQMLIETTLLTVEFAKLIQHWDAENAQVDIMDPVDWDSDGQYANIIDAVSEATRGNDVRVYRVARDLTRAEYWVISRDDKEGRIVGVKALGVES